MLVDSGVHCRQKIADIFGGIDLPCYAFGVETDRRILRDVFHTAAALSATCQTNRP